MKNRHTVRSALQRARLLFRERGVETGALDAEVLLAHVLGCGRGHLYREPDAPLGPAEQARFEELVHRRLAGEPVAYLVGRREFMGLEFKVDARVLVPRPETELLVETALVLLGWARPPAATVPAGLPTAPATGIAVDVGTGSGAVAVSLARFLPQLRVFATDISPAALEVARENARRHGVDRRVEFLPGSLLKPLRGRGLEKKAALVAANLPYIPTGELPNLPAGVRDFEPRVALDGGPDGLSPHRRLLAAAGDYLAPGGYLLLEIGPGQGETLAQEAPAGFRSRVVRDLAGRERLVVMRAPA